MAHKLAHFFPSILTDHKNRNYLVIQFTDSRGELQMDMRIPLYQNDPGAVKDDPRDQQTSVA